MAASLAAEALFSVGSIPITNTILETVIVDGLMVGGVYFLHKNISEIPNMFQNIMEIAVEALYDLTDSIAGKNAMKIFPWFMGFFVFILLANWLSLFPGFGTIGFFRGEEFVPLLRSVSSDINFTLGIALLSVIATHMYAVKSVGWKDYLSRYFSFNPIFLFVGILELISVFTTIISLSFRLFGNIFAGEVVLSTISNMFAFILPLPFMALEIIVGLVQALVFAILTMAFMAIFMTPHHAEGGESH